MLPGFLELGQGPNMGLSAEDSRAALVGQVLVAKKLAGHALL